MPILLGLEVAAAFGVASALRSGYGNALGLTVGEAASKAASLARSFVSETPSESGESSNAPSSSHEDGVRHDAGASTPVDKRSIDAVAPTSPVRVRMRVRSMRLPRLFAEPVFLDEAAGEGVLSGARMLEQLAHAVPRRFGDAGGKWHLLFSTTQHGTSLAHLLRRTSGAGPCLLLIRDSENRLFGAYCSSLGDAEGGEATGAGHFYGSGESFLFALCMLALPMLPTSPATPCRAADGSAQTRLALYSFGWTRRNNHFIRSDSEGLFLGSGTSFGLCLDTSLLHGSTGPSTTFDNPPLTAVAQWSQSGASSPCCGAGPQLGQSGSSCAAGTPGAATADRSEQFRVSALEVWGVDEVACRALRQCAKHVQIRAEASASAPPGSAC